MKCENCGHRVRSINIYDSWKLRDKNNSCYPYTHSKHGEDGNCKVKGCNCYKIKVSDASEDQSVKGKGK